VEDNASLEKVRYMEEIKVRGDVPIGPQTTVRDAVKRYPGIEKIFARHGLGDCGGPDGPIEPIGFFARVHEVDPDDLLAALNAYAAEHAALPARKPAARLALMEERPSQVRQLYFIGIATSLAIAILGGLPLGILVALGGARDMGLGVHWAPLIQAHGHLQIVGFAAIFIAGVAYHVLPRFKNTELRTRRVGLASIVLLASGSILRTTTQPWADSAGVDLLFALSAVIELAGALAFASVVVRTVRAGQPAAFDPYLLSACTWLAGASAMNLVVVTDAASDGSTFIASSRNGPLLEMYLAGFATIFILGVSIRVLPHFLSLRPLRVHLVAPALGLVTAGLVLHAGAGWVDAYSSWSRPDWLSALAIYVSAAGVAVFVYALNVLAPSTRPHGEKPGPQDKLVRTAYLWLLAAFALEAFYATKSLTGDFRPDFFEGGAARHALALGFLTQMIMGIGSRAIPTFAGRQLWSPRLVTVYWLLINAAALMRVGHAAVPWGDNVFRWDHIAAAGAFALIALVLFALNIDRSVRGTQARRGPAPAPKPAPKGGPAPMQDTPPAAEGFTLGPTTVVAEVLANVPGSLEMLIAYGFKPLADPEMRARVTPHVTLATAAGMHGIDLQTLIGDLEALRSGGTAEVSPEQRVRNALRECYDPEIPVNIVDLGLVVGVRTEGERASIEMTLTSPDCPLADQVVADVKKHVQDAGFSDVDVTLVREPAWEPSRMTPAAKQALGWQ
jgi:metal-sulfur cluster biosynthetic enzyme